MPVSIEQAQEQELKQEALTVVQRATLVKITDQDSYNSACDLLQKEIVPFRRKWADYWKPLTSAAWNSYKKIQERFKEFDEPAEMAERAVKTEIRRWDDQKLREEAELQRKAQEEAERQAQEEQLRAAIVAEQSGASEQEVQAIVNSPIVAIASPVAESYERARGISRRENWKCRVVDFHALVKAAAKDKTLLAYLQPNEQALNARAKADRSTLALAGCVAYDDSIVSARGR